MPTNPKLSKIGFFGGTFDPIHIGHTAIAEMAIEVSGLDTLLICPAFQSPLRKNKNLFQTADRLSMINEFVKLNPRIEVFDYEINKPQPSFTYLTIERLKLIYPDAKFFLIIGDDQFVSLPKWKNIDQLSDAVHFLVFRRTLQTTPEAPIPNINYTLMENPLIDISSTSIRACLSAGISIREMVPQPVFNYLKRNHLLV